MGRSYQQLSLEERIEVQVHRERGVYGSQGVVAAANTPGARSQAANLTDSNGVL